MAGPIAVVGAGGVGGYFAGALATAGYEVHVLARGAHLNAMRANGGPRDRGARRHSSDRSRPRHQ